jgi:hypothetical protein
MTSFFALPHEEVAPERSLEVVRTAVAEDPVVAAKPEDDVVALAAFEGVRAVAALEAPARGRRAAGRANELRTLPLASAR